MAYDKNNIKIQIFEGQKVRTVWSEEEQQWYFSIVDICWILTESKDYDTARKYWNKLKQRLVEEGNESVTNCHQLKLVSPKDGKRYLTDVATQPQLCRSLYCRNLEITKPQRLSSKCRHSTQRRADSRRSPQEAWRADRPFHHFSWTSFRLSSTCRPMGLPSGRNRDWKWRWSVIRNLL